MPTPAPNTPSESPNVAVATTVSTIGQSEEELLIPTAPETLFELSGDDPLLQNRHTTLDWDAIPEPPELSRGEDLYRDLANRLLTHARTSPEYGHHVDVSRSLTDWANQYRDSEDAPDYWRPMAFKLSPKEINQGRVSDDGGAPEEGELSIPQKKARTVLAWASEVFDESLDELVGKDIRAEHMDHWEQQVESTIRTRQGIQFLSTPPAYCNGWVRLRSPSNSLVYAGYDDGEPIVAVLFESDEFTRLFTADVDEYRQFARPECHRIEYDEFDTTVRRERLSNPDSWVEGAYDLLKYIRERPSDTESLVKNSNVVDDYHYSTPDLDGVKAPQSFDDSFDPVQQDLPDGWTLKSHQIGGNRDIDGMRELAVWSHEYRGQIVVESLPDDDSEYVVSTSLPRHRPSEPLTRESAYNHAVELLASYSENPKISKRLLEMFGSPNGPLAECDSDKPEAVIEAVVPEWNFGLPKSTLLCAVATVTRIERDTLEEIVESTGFECQPWSKPSGPAFDQVDLSTF